MDVRRKRGNASGPNLDVANTSTDGWLERVFVSMEWLTTNLAEIECCRLATSRCSRII